MDPGFLIGVKCTIFWIDSCLRVYFDLYAADFPKNTHKSKYTLKPLFCQNMVHVPPLSQGPRFKFGNMTSTSSTELKSNFPLAISVTL